jgi:hypothetical protein
MFTVYFDRSLVFIAHNTHLSFLFWKSYSIEICFNSFAYVCYANNK